MANILIVDDDSVLQSSCTIALRRAGLRPIVARNGLEGLKEYLCGREEISLVVSDVRMPLMNGVDLVRGIFYHNPDAKVILMSDEPPPELEPKEHAKLCHFIRKPFTITYFLEVVKKCLDAAEKATMWADRMPEK
jgi:two-component system cell cycle sensor histidine kinase/response regulator CckA